MSMTCRLEIRYEGLAGKNAGIETRETMVEEFLAKVVVEGLLGTIAWVVAGPSTPVTLVKGKGSGPAFCCAFGILMFWGVEHGLVALHADEAFGASRKLCSEGERAVVRGRVIY
jgi:hypothetical protein